MAPAWWQGAWLKERGYALLHVRALSPAQERALAAGDGFKDCTACPEMVAVPEGEFVMGSPDNVGDSFEHPQHQVRIARRFAVGKYELTFSEWDACVTWGDCTAENSEEMVALRSVQQRSPWSLYRPRSARLYPGPERPWWRRRVREPRPIR